MKIGHGPVSALWHLLQGNTYNIHPLFHLLCNSLPTEVHLCTKTSLYFPFPLTPSPHIPSVAPRGASISVRRVELGFIPMRWCVVQTGATPSVRTRTVPEHCWFWVSARHSSIPRAEVAVATGLLRMSERGGSGLFCFQLLLLICASVLHTLVVPSNCSAEGTAQCSQSTNTCHPGRWCVFPSQMERSVFSLCWRVLTGFIASVNFFFFFWI